MSSAELANKMAVLLGGRAAEALVFGDVSTGAADDLAKATDIARSMVVRYGMVQDLGAVSYEADPAPLLGATAEMWRPRRYSETSAAAIDKAVHQLIDAALAQAASILTGERSLLDSAATALLQQETLSGPDLAAALGRTVQAETTVT